MTDNRGVKIIRQKAYVVSILFSFTIILGIVFSYTFFGPNAESISENMTSQKLVILNFDDGREYQLVNAKPVLDKYGSKQLFI